MAQQQRLVSLSTQSFFNSFSYRFDYSSCVKLTLTIAFLLCIVVPFNNCKQQQQQLSYTTPISLDVLDSNAIDGGKKMEAYSGRGRARTPSHPPEGWFCSAEHYNSRDGCHCLCGAHDPDCDDLVNHHLQTTSSDTTTLDKTGKATTTTEKIVQNAINCPCPEQQLLILKLPCFFYLKIIVF